MTTGISLHIGINEVDVGHYGSKHQLDGCENDAVAMAKIAATTGFTTITTLTTEQAVSTDVIAAISGAAGQLQSGDLFWLSFSGHGTVIENKDNPPDEPIDQAWALYDRLFIDDELFDLLTTFNPGVRISVASDSCYSGTITSFLQARFGTYAIPQEILDLPPAKVRVISYDDAAAVYQAHFDLYSQIQRRLADVHLRKLVRASVLLISACQDWEQAQDGNPHGLFTQALVDVWQDGRFRGDYEVLWAAIAEEVTSIRQHQNPNWYPSGVPNIGFYRSPAFLV
jgi:hypothetical protein